MKLAFAPALAVAALLVSAPQPAPAQTPQQQMMFSNYVRLLFAAAEALDAQSDFNVARAAGNTGAMDEAAVRLLASTASAAFWSTVLDRQVTPENTSEALDSHVAELNDLAIDVFRNLVPLVEAADFDAIDARLDDSANNLNKLFQLTDEIAQKTGAPRLPR